MKEQLKQRLQSLKEELASGQKVLADLDAKQANVRDTLLRIAGAIQVLEEEIAKAEEDTNSVAPTVEAESLSMISQNNQSGGALD